jgi:hypothetical protein
MAGIELPEFRDWGIAAVRLLQGVVYADDLRPWELVLSSRSQLASYFARLGLLLIVDESEGLAYLRQLNEDELAEGYERLPKLFHRARLGYDETILCVLLREQLRRFEEEDLHNERCVVEAAVLFDRWRILSQAQDDEVRARRAFSSALGKLAEIGFVRRLADEPEAWEIRRILKARLPVSELESLKARMLGAAAGQSVDHESGGSDG